MKTLVLNAKEERRLLRGHLWAYRNEFRSIPGNVEEGELVDVVAWNQRHVGRGFFQASGGIAVRMLTVDRATIDAAFFAERIVRSKQLRERLYPDSDVYRWVFGESDGLPGFVADRYGAQIVGQSSCGFYAGHAEALGAAFLSHGGVSGVRLFLPGGVVEFGEVCSPIACMVNGLTFSVDAGSGQKTGLFLDQRENWALLRPFAAGASVLDGYCYSGAWSLNAAMWGAARVLGVDTSQGAVDAARGHAEANGVADRCEFECADVQEVLARDAAYDVVLVDPPALAKSRAHVAKALGLYHAVNRDALKRVRPGGILITSTCSHFVDAPAFLEMLKRAAISAQRSARLLAVRGAAADHPVLLAMPETGYLTCSVVEVS